MLVLSRKTGEKIIINGSITITVIRIKGDRVAIGIEAPKTVEVHRAEVVTKEKSTMSEYDDELWDENDSETIKSTCERCGEITLVQLLEDPFVTEQIIEPEDGSNGSGYWCKKCYENRKDDV